jgi:hypothetical protein
MMLMGKFPDWEAGFVIAAVMAAPLPETLAYKKAFSITPQVGRPEMAKGAGCTTPFVEGQQETTKRWPNLTEACTKFKPHLVRL